MKKQDDEKHSICIIGVSTKKHTDMMLLEGAKKHFDSVLFIPISSVRMITEKGTIKVRYRETDLSKFDVIFLRVPESQYDSAYLILNNLSARSLKVQETKSILLVSNRLSMFQNLAKAGIRVPKVCLANTADAAARAFKELKFPVLVRVPSDKEKIMIAENSREAKTMMDTLETLKQPIFLEEYYMDVNLFQVLVVGGEIISTVKLKSGDIGYEKGKIVSERAPIGVRKLATRAAALLETKIARVDILDAKEPIVVGVNITPDIARWSKHKKDLGDKIMARVKRVSEIEKGGFVAKFLEDLRLAVKDTVLPVL
jgi:glutathione synthase/RimK-type ligase-like ATP-grasp enzyme